MKSFPQNIQITKKNTLYFLIFLTFLFVINNLFHQKNKDNHNIPHAARIESLSLYYSCKVIEKNFCKDILEKIKKQNVFFLSTSEKSYNYIKIYEDKKYRGRVIVIAGNTKKVVYSMNEPIKPNQFEDYYVEAILEKIKRGETK